MMMTANYIEVLIDYAIQKGLISKKDSCESRNKLYHLFQIEGTPILSDIKVCLEECLEFLIDVGLHSGFLKHNTIDERDAFEAKLFDYVMPSPYKVKHEFAKLAAQSSVDATQYLYRLSQDVNYIKVNRLQKNMKWIYKSRYGNLELTINLAKPEKDPRDIIKESIQQIDDKNQPKCALCKENEQNYYNSRMNLRIVPIHLNQELWHFQYSPYQYFNEHSIILHDSHRPMKITNKTFNYLFDFIDQFPTYFIGSNADIPIVGGSILSHDHYQAGCNQFPIEFAEVIHQYIINDITIELLYWPLSTIRIRSISRNKLYDLAMCIYNSWLVYENIELGIRPYSVNVKHQSITPIVRMNKNHYEMDIILRNNRTTTEYPDGIFHPHQDVHHIKKENIGLIEAMGLAILPGRLKNEIEQCLSYINNHEQSKDIEKHMTWIYQLKDKGVSSYSEMLNEIGSKFERVIEDSGVFKMNQQGIKAFQQFIEEVIYCK